MRREYYFQFNFFILILIKKNVFFFFDFISLAIRLVFFLLLSKSFFFLPMSSNILYNTFSRGATRLDVRFEKDQTNGEFRAFVNVQSDAQMEMLLELCTTDDFFKSVGALDINSDFYKQPSTTLFVDMSSLGQIRRLAVRWGVVCIHLPPNLQELACGMQNLMHPYLLPPSVREFCKIYYTTYTPQSHYSDAFAMLIKNNQQLTDIFVPVTSEEDNVDAVFDAICARSTPLASLSVDTMSPLTAEHFLKIAPAAIVLKCSINQACCQADVSHSSALRKITFGYPVPFSWLTGNWTYHLEELTMATPNFDDLGMMPFDHVIQFATTHLKLKSLNLMFPTRTHIGKFANVIELLPCQVNLFFPKHVLAMGTLSSEIILATQSSPKALVEVKGNAVCIKHNIAWLPWRHKIFSFSAQQTLKALAIGLTRLKKFHHLLPDEARDDAGEVLVHVDPACIEWMMEDLRQKDFM